MNIFFRKKEVNTEEPADFVLFGSDENIDDTTLANNDVSSLKEAENFEDTASLDVSAVVSALDNSNKKSRKSIFTGNKISTVKDFIYKRKFLSAAVAVILVIAIISSLALGIMSFANPLRGYAQVASTKETIMYTMDVEGTLALGNQYEITSLVSGKIISSKFDVGDEVKAGDELYKLDDTEAKLAVEKAKNEVNKTSDSSYGTSSLVRIISTDAGVVQSINIKAGSMVSPGTQVGTIKKADGSVSAIIAYMSGEVTVVSVRTGQSLSAGQIIASVTPKSDKQYSAEYDKKSSEIDLQAAQRHLEHYSIKSPVSGVVVKKNAKSGDNVGITDSDRPMMVILDTSTLNFTFSVDEYKLREIRKGQEVIVTTESIPDTTFSGEISSISSEGKPDDNGKPYFDVTVTVYEPGKLKSGMHIKANIILASVSKVVSIPEKALIESDGQNALVFVKNEELDDNGDVDLSGSIETELEYPHIKVPDGCLLVSVKYGLSDGNLVQIISGLEIGEIVVYNPQKDNAFVKTTIDIDEFIKNNKDTKKDTTKKNEEQATDIPFDSDDATEQDIPTNDAATSDTTTNDESNKGIESQLKSEIEKIINSQNNI